MKIISKIKDYYDYVVSIYGIDDKIVYDRRDCEILNRVVYCESYFSQKKDLIDNTKSNVYNFLNPETGKYEKIKGRHLFCTLEVGLKWYCFSIHRYLENPNDETIKLTWKLEHVIEITKDEHVSSSPLTFYPGVHWDRWCGKSDMVKRLKTALTDSRYISYNGEPILNPILTGTQIPNFIPPEEMYQDIYSYISATNDIDIKDNRTDVQKLESAGFDKKISFRNVK